MPLITSCDKNARCKIVKEGSNAETTCKKKASYCCPDVNCSTLICKQCFSSFNKSNRHYIQFEETMTQTNDLDSDASDDVSTVYEETCDDIDNNSENILDDINSDQSILSDDNIDEQDEFDSIIMENMANDEHNEYDDIDNLLTYSDPPDIPYLDEIRNEIPTTQAGESAYIINHAVTTSNQRVNAHVILNQNCSTLSQQDYSLRGYNCQQNFLQKICATSPKQSIPLLYPEAMIFPGIFYYMINTCGSIVGALPAGLLAYSSSKFGFASIQDHIHTRITSASSSTSTNTRYISFVYDILVNLSLNREDSRMIINRGLVASTNDTGLEVRGKADTKLYDSVDSKAMVRNLCASQRYHKMHFFLTFTCNQKKHFGTSAIKEWIDGDKWKTKWDGFEDLTPREQKEVHKQLMEAAGPLMLCNWMESRAFFYDYLRGSPSSPYFPADAILYEMNIRIGMVTSPIFIL